MDVIGQMLRLYWVAPLSGSACPVKSLGKAKSRRAYIGGVCVDFLHKAPEFFAHPEAKACNSPKITNCYCLW